MYKLFLVLLAMYCKKHITLNEEKPFMDDIRIQVQVLSTAQTI